LPAYHEIVQTVFLELLDGKLATPEEAPELSLSRIRRPHRRPRSPSSGRAPNAGTEAKLKGDSFDDEPEDPPGSR